MMPSQSCICKYINSLQTNTRFVILMHPKEYKKERNGTGRMTKLQLKNSEIIVGIDFTNNKRVNELLAIENSRSFLLYPGVDNFNLSERESSEIIHFVGKNSHLFILDGTWPCARKMLKMSKNLQELNRISFDNEIVSKFLFKQQPAPLCLSTIESVYKVLNLLNKSNLENCDTEGFLIPFEKMVDYQVKCMLDPSNQKYRPYTKNKITPKDLYRRDTQRSIVFELDK